MQGETVNKDFEAAKAEAFMQAMSHLGFVLMGLRDFYKEFFREN